MTLFIWLFVSLRRFIRVKALVLKATNSTEYFQRTYTLIACTTQQNEIDYYPSSLLWTN